MEKVLYLDILKIIYDKLDIKSQINLRATNHFFRSHFKSIQFTKKQFEKLNHLFHRLYLGHQLKKPLIDWCLNGDGSFEVFTPDKTEIIFSICFDLPESSFNENGNISELSDLEVYITKKLRYFRFQNQIHSFSPTYHQISTMLPPLYNTITEIFDQIAKADIKDNSLIKIVSQEYYYNNIYGNQWNILMSQFFLNFIQNPLTLRYEDTMHMYMYKNSSPQLDEKLDNLGNILFDSWIKEYLILVGDNQILIKSHANEFIHLL